MDNNSCYYISSSTISCIINLYVVIHKKQTVKLLTIAKKQRQNTYSKTNIHYGLNEAMQMLMSEDETTVLISGENGEEQIVQRIPYVVLMSDGAPTASGGDTSDWWNPSGVSGNGFVNRSGLDVFKAVMNAAYQKQQVSQHYRKDMQVYTVGVGVEAWSNTEREMAEITLNPEKCDEVESSRLQELWETWELYQTGADVTVGFTDRQYTFTHPPTGDIKSLFYSDAYFSAKNPENITEAFQQVLNKIVVSGAVPTNISLILIILVSPIELT